MGLLALVKRKGIIQHFVLHSSTQIALSNLRLAGNLEILILIRRISIATGEGSLGHILCSGRGSKESVAVLWTQTK